MKRGQGWTVYQRRDILVQNMRGLMIAIGIVSIGYGVLMLFDSGVFSTRYAAGYSESGFSRIRRGMSTNEAIRLVGKPLYENCYASYSCWEYTENARKRFPRYKLRMFCVTNGGVAEIYRGIID